MIEPQIADFGTWESTLSASLIFQDRHSVSNPIPWRDGVLFLLTIPDEQSALALMFCDSEGKTTRISPPGFSLRSRVHEYGGLPFGCSDDEVFYCNFKDQEIYRQRFDTSTQEFDEPEQTTNSHTDDVRYCELIVDHKRQRLICVREDHRHSNGNASAVINTLVAIPLSAPRPVTTEEQLVLFAKTDFVSNPRLAADDSYISFVTWSHPNMPWDNTEIHVAQFTVTGELNNLIEVDPGQASSKVQPSFDADNNLYFLSDWGDYWNLAKVECDDLGSDCLSRIIYSVAADCCGPAWETGKSNYAVLNNADILISVVKDCRWQLRRVNLLDQSVEVLDSNLGVLEQIRANKHNKVFFLAASTDDYPCIYSINSTRSATTAAKTKVVNASLPKELTPALISQAQHFQFKSHGGAVAYGLLYLPKNPQFTRPNDQLPPLLVNVHGGPTGTARAALNPMHQFWTSRGYAVLDLNHRGSSGYGRKFRQLLYGQWGVVDIEDVVAAVQYLLDSKQVAPGKIAIRGGSAGGYAVLASLAACDLFAAGTSYYGVSDLELLARDTHKFESRYLDHLVGPYPAAKEIYKARSPINKLTDIKAAVLILQGEDDKVVPPNQAILINRMLSTQNPATEYISFKGEGHGFRLPSNQIRSLEAELSFYRRNLLGLA